MSKLKAKDPKAAEPSKPKILIFGSFGVAKTWGALSFPNAYFIDTEGGANIPEYTDRLKTSGGRYMGPEDGSCDLQEILEQVQALATEKHEFKTLIIDSITKPFNNAITQEADRLEKAGKKNEFSVDKKPAIAAMKRLVMWLDRLDMNVILIAREKAEWKGGEQVGFQADVWDQVNYELHLVLRISKSGPDRMAKVVKTRLRGFPDADSFNWTTSNALTDTTARDEFIARMGKGIMDAATPISMATAEQVVEIKRLVELLNTPATITDKWLEKANAESFADFNTEQAAAIITLQTSKIK